MDSLLNDEAIKSRKYAAEVIVYFEKHKLIEISKKICVECALERPEDVQLWIGKNIKRIAGAIYEDCKACGRYGVMKALHITTNYPKRIVIFGRPGSGRHTQVRSLVKRYGLVLLDAEILIFQHLRGDDENPNDPLDRELQRAFYYDNCEAKFQAIDNIIARRILLKDCLTQGWILLNFPYTLQAFKRLFEHITINKLIYLKCEEKMCMLRLANIPDLGKINHSHSYYEKEMQFFQENLKEIEQYLKQRYETVEIDASANSMQITNTIFRALDQTAYRMGYK